MGHDHHHHDTSQQSDARLLWAVGVNVLLTVAQIVGGVLSGSLALVADALHNLNDAASLGLALLARRIARRPADRKRTFGYRKAELIGALINLTTLIIVGLYLIYEAIWRFFDPQPIAGWIVIFLAGIALVVDVITALLTFAMSKGNLNVKAAFVHNLSDAFASVAVIVAGTLILLYEWYWADWVATLIISAYILWHGAVMLRSTIRILMDSVPEDIDLDELVAAMEAVEHVEQVHHIHVWQLDEHHRALEAHVVLDTKNLDQLETIKDTLKATLQTRYDIGHSTLEFETHAAHRQDRQVVSPH
jgi:cobalt-zinc-cadmium efflux system protein